MSLEQKGRNTYYYSKQRVNDRVVSRYIGKVGGKDLIGQILLDLDESCRHIREMEKQEHQAKITLMILRHNKQFSCVDEAITRINVLAKVTLIAFGHHQHKGQWRKARANTNLEGRTAIMIDARNIHKFDPELATLIRAVADKERGTKEAKALRAYLESHPEMWRNLYEISQCSIDNLLDHNGNDTLTSELFRVRLKALKEDLGWNESSTLVRLMIEAVVMSYLRWCLAEMSYSTNCDGTKVTLATAKFLEKKLMQSQKQYLRACEALARVRRLSLNCPEMSQDFTQDHSLIM